MRNPCSWVWVAFVVAATSVPAASDAQESELAQPVIAPAMPMSDEALSIVLPKTADVSVVWIKDGEETTQSGLTLPAKYTKRGELWAVRVTGKGSSTSVRSDAVTIRNSPPTVGKLVLKPEYVDATTPLTCMPISVRDADRDQLALRYRWLVDDQPVRMTTDTMEAGRLKRGQSVRCELTVLDGQSASEPVASEVRTVGNSPPTAGSLVLHPDEATVLSDLRCSLDSVGDADREALRYAFRWTQGGGEGEKAWTIETKTPSSTVAAKDLKRGQVLSCTGQVLDAEAASDPLTKRVVIQNSAPTLDAVTVSPGTPRTSDDLVCQHTGETDPDGDVLRSEYRWRVRGELIHRGPTLPAQLTRERSAGRLRSACVGWGVGQ